MKRFILIVYTFIFSTIAFSQAEKEISLAGKWQVKLDSLNVGMSQNWPQKSFRGAAVTLPGTLDDAGLGTASIMKPAITNDVLSNLVRKHRYVGVAYYQREINIPAGWKNKQVTLSLERVIWQSTVFLDGVEIGKAESLVSSHQFALPKSISTGKHLLTIAIDNGNKYPNINISSDKYPDPKNQDMAHAYTNHTQIKWNGIIGDITLKVSAVNSPKNLQIYPDVDHDKIKFSFEQPDLSSKKFSYELTDKQGEVIKKGTIINTQRTEKVIVTEIGRPKKLTFWDEFNPDLYTLKVMTNSGEIQAKFGFSCIKNDKGVLTLNNHRIFLRGNLECVIFPLTGHPPMKKSEWATLIRQAKDYGLNHLRFHSWCPPEAAFAAADEAGFYFQVELPHWNLEVGKDAATNKYLYDEADRILTDYGNHPSLIMFSLGNELQGNAGFLNKMVADLRKKDDRHLYTTTTFSFQKPMGLRPEPEDDFFVTQWTDKGWVRGQGIFNDKAPNFNLDYTASSEHINVPLITHEIGQYSVYPDLREIPKYTGVLMPLNFIAVKNDLEKKGLLNQAAAFTQASGKLAALLYKEEIERALKTPGIDGFQLLQLQDFPGQGTALVGLLNAFWESKGIINATEFRKFNSEIVPLIRFEKAVYEDGETFRAIIEIANFYQEKEQQTIVWTIKNDAGKIIKMDSIVNQKLILGNNSNLGTIELPLTSSNAERMTVSVKLRGTAYENNWHFWVYPKAMVQSTDIIVTTSYKEATDALQQGKKVLFNPKTEDIKGVKGRFTPVFWSPVHFPDQPGTMGLLIDEKHPAFQEFPTESYTNWQWWDLCTNSKSVIVDDMPITQLVQTIDNFVTNHHLSGVFEAKVGSGQLIFSGMDISNDLGNRPAARQLRNSLLNYMTGEKFKPQTTISSKELKTLLN